jgi:hypothetical protein
MDLAIYCHMQHRLGKIELPVLEVWKAGPGRHEIVFDDPHDVVSKLEMEFTNSPEAANFAAAQRSLKSIMREKTVHARPDSGRAVKHD